MKINILIAAVSGGKETRFHNGTGHIFELAVSTGKYHVCPMSHSKIPLYDKSQVQEKVKIFVRRAQREFGLPIKKIRSDNRTEFKNTLVEEFLDDEGIKHEFSTPYTPQQNGVVERKNRTLLDMARTMLDEYKTSDLFWSDAVNTLAMPSTASTYTRNSRRLHMSF
jgi:transposase InsO family protein